MRDLDVHGRDRLEVEFMRDWEAMQDLARPGLNTVLSQHPDAERENVESDSVFEGFVVSREHLLRRFDETRAQLDEWFADNRRRQVGITQLAMLEGLLAERRELLSQLLDLDDAFVDHLVGALARKDQP